MTLLTLIEAFRVLSAQLAAFEALLLLVSAVHKLVKWSRSRGVLRQFAGVPASLTALVLAVVCTAEFVAAAMLVTPSTRIAGALLACLLWTAPSLVAAVTSIVDVVSVLRTDWDLSTSCATAYSWDSPCSSWQFAFGLAATRFRVPKCWRLLLCWPSTVHWIK
jgi:hypothetical protein